VRRRFLLVFNPTAGRASRHIVDAVAAELRAHGGVAIEPAASASAGEACAAVRAAAASGRFDAVIAAGGDGTIRQAAAGALGTPLPVGIVPIGTGNVMAHEIASTNRPAEIARTLLDGPVARLSGGLANGEPFFLWTGAGFDGRIVQALDQGLKHRIGKAAYVRPTLAALSEPLDVLDVVVDGKHHRAAWVIVSNARNYGGAFVLVDRTHALVEGLHAVLFKPASRIELVRHLLALARGRLMTCKGVEMLPCHHVVIRSARPVPAQVDGDNFGTTPLDVRASADEVGIIVPDGFQQRLGVRLSTRVHQP
jgi:diacylglycerol kinase family enzyme